MDQNVSANLGRLTYHARGLDADLWLGVLFAAAVLYGLVVWYLDREPRRRYAVEKSELDRRKSEVTVDHALLVDALCAGRTKDPRTSFWSCLLGGNFGCHYFYLGRPAFGFASLIFFSTGIPGLIAFFYSFSIMPSVRRRNIDIAHEAFASVEAI